MSLKALPTCIFRFDKEVTPIRVSRCINSTEVKVTSNGVQTTSGGDILRGLHCLSIFVLATVKDGSHQFRCIQFPKLPFNHHRASSMSPLSPCPLSCMSRAGFRTSEALLFSKSVHDDVARGLGSAQKQQYSLPAPLEAVAPAVHLQDVDMVSEPVRQATGQSLRAEYVCPFVKRRI